MSVKTQDETSYRGFLLPRMRGSFGRWDWVANGVLVTPKKVYQRWLYPGYWLGAGFCLRGRAIGQFASGVHQSTNENSRWRFDCHVGLCDTWRNQKSAQRPISFEMTNAPKGIRTPVAGLKGQCPGPLDDGGDKHRQDSTMSKGRVKVCPVGCSATQCPIHRARKAA